MKCMKKATEEFLEEDHPRDEDGKFTLKGSRSNKDNVNNNKIKYDVTTDKTGRFETGKPVTFDYAHNKEKSPYLGSRFGQDIEPHGKYILEKTKGSDYERFPERWETGTITFKNPLVIKIENTVQWKKDLVKATGKKGKKLTDFLIDEGYDGIVTVYEDGNTSEIIRLFKKQNSNEEFKEEEHPRDADGKFVKKGGGSSVVLEDENYSNIMSLREQKRAIKNNIPNDNKNIKKINPDFLYSGRFYKKEDNAIVVGIYQRESDMVSVGIGYEYRYYDENGKLSRITQKINQQIVSDFDIDENGNRVEKDFGEDEFYSLFDDNITNDIKQIKEYLESPPVISEYEEINKEIDEIKQKIKESKNKNEIKNLNERQSHLIEMKKIIPLGEKYDNLYDLRTLPDINLFREIMDRLNKSDVDDLEKIDTSTITDTYEKATFDKIKRLQNKIDSDKKIQKFGFDKKIDYKSILSYIDNKYMNNMLYLSNTNEQINTRLNTFYNYKVKTKMKQLNDTIEWFYGDTKLDKRNEYITKKYKEITNASYTYDNIQRFDNEIITPLVKDGIHVYDIDDDIYGNEETKTRKTQQILNQLNHLKNKNLHDGKLHIHMHRGDKKLFGYNKWERENVAGTWDKENKTIHLYNTARVKPWTQTVTQILNHEFTHALYDKKIKESYSNENTKLLLEKFSKECLKLTDKDISVVDRIFGSYGGSYVRDYKKNGRNGWGVNLETEIMSAITDNLNYTEIQKKFPDLFESYMSLIGGEIDIYNQDIIKLKESKNNKNIIYDIKYIDDSRNIVSKNKAKYVFTKVYEDKKIIFFEISYLNQSDEKYVIKSTGSESFKCMKKTTEEFREEDHPRDEDGKFVKKGTSSHTKDNFDEFIKELDDIKYEKNDDVIRYIKHNLNEIEKYGKPTDLEKENIIVDKMEADWLESLNLDRGDIFEKFRIENPNKKDEWGNWVDFDENSYIESMPEDLKKMYKDVKSKKEHEIEYSKKNNKWTPYYEPFSDYPFLYPKLSKYQKDELASEQWDSYDFEEKQDVYDYFFKKELEEDIDYADLDYYEKQEIRNDWSKYGDLTDSYLTKEKEWYYQDKEYKKLYDEYSKLGVSYGDYNERGIESNFWNYYKGVPEKQSIETIDNWRFKIMFADDNQELGEYKIPKYPIVDKLSVEEHNNTIKELRDKTPNIKKEISNDFKNIIDYAEKKENLQFQLHVVSNFAKQMGREKSDLKELFLNEIRTGNITVSDFVSNYEKSKQLEFFSDMITSNEDIEKMYNDLTKKMDKINHENYDLFLKSPEFYRGTTTEELDSFIKDETFKSGKYDFKSLSMDRKQATGNSINSNADGFRCVIVFEGDGVRDVGIPIQYNPVPVEPNFTFGDKSERIDTPLPMVFLEEREVRIPIGKKIPKIKELNFGDSLSEEQKKEIMEKYSSLTDNIKFEKFRADEHYVIKSIDSEGLKCMKKATEEFKEEDHPRDEDGKFTNKGGGSSVVVLEDEIKEHIPKGDIVGSTTIRDPEDYSKKYDIEWGDMEYDVDAISDFRDKNNLWRELELNPDNDRDQEMTVEGEMLEDAMKQWGETDYPDGSVYLTRDGTWVGGKSIYGYDEDHRPQIRRGLRYAGIQIKHTEDSRFNNSSDLTDGLNISGMIRARASPNKELSLDISHSITSSQRRAIQNFMIENNLSEYDLIIDLGNKMKDGNEDTILRSLSYESYSKEEFKEEDHPRDEDGKFTDKGSGVNKKIKDLGKKIQRNTHKDILLKYTKDIFGQQWYNDLQGAIGGKEQYERYIEAEKKWRNMIDNEPEFKKIYDDLKKEVDDYNVMLQDKFENTDVFYRGTSIEELDSYIKDNCIGCDFQSRYHGGKGKLYDFVSMSMNTEELWLFNHGVVIEYDAESIRNNGAKRIKYSAYPVPFMAQKLHVENKLNLEDMGMEYPHRFAEEQEVRIGKTDINKIKIKKIHVDMSKIEGFLREHVGLKNFDNYDDFGKGSDSEEIRKRLLNMYGSITDDVVIHTGGIDYDTI